MAFAIPSSAEFALSSAADRVFAIPELLENILLFVATPAPPSTPAGPCRREVHKTEALRSIYRCQGVSQSFLAVIRASAELQYSMYLQPRPADHPDRGNPEEQTNPLLSGGWFVRGKQPRFMLTFDSRECDTDGMKFFCELYEHRNKPKRGRWRKLHGHQDSSWRRMRCSTVAQVPDTSSSSSSSSSGVSTPQAQPSNGAIMIDYCAAAERSGRRYKTGWLGFDWDLERPMGQLLDFVARACAEYGEGGAEWSSGFVSGRAADIDGIEVTLAFDSSRTVWARA